MNKQLDTLSQTFFGYFGKVTVKLQHNYQQNLIEYYNCTIEFDDKVVTTFPVTYSADKLLQQHIDITTTELLLQYLRENDFVYPVQKEFAKEILGSELEQFCYGMEEKSLDKA